MGIPLNIDWQQILLHAFNFIILAAGLTFLLFKPVKKFMAAREQSYKKAAEEHRQKLDELESFEKERQAKIAALDGELAEREQKAVAAADAHSKRIVAEARDEAEKIISDGKKRAAVEREKYIAGAGDEITSLITSLIVRSAEKLLAAESNAATDGALYDRYLSLALSQQPLPPERRAEMSAVAQNGGSGQVLRRSDIADILGDAAASAIMSQGAESDSAVYDRFLSEVNKNDGN